MSFPLSLSNLTALPEQLYDAIPPSVQPFVTRQNLQNILRIVVIIATYLLFRPHLETLFRKASGFPDPRQAEIQARLEALQTGEKITPQTGRPKGVAGVGMVGSGGRVVKLVIPEGEEGEGKGGQQQQQSEGKTSGRAKTKARRRA